MIGFWRVLIAVYGREAAGDGSHELRFFHLKCDDNAHLVLCVLYI